MSSFKEIIKSNKYLYHFFWPLIRCRREILKLQGNELDNFINFLPSIVVDGSFVVDLPDFCGLFEIDYRSDIFKTIIMQQNYEAELVKLLNKHINPSKDVIDVGANIGLFTIFMAKIISDDNKVLSIEPTPGSLKYLYRNIKRNNSANAVIVYDGIVSNSKGDYRLNVITGMEEYSSLAELVAPAIKGKDSKQIDVKGETIDNLVKRYNLTPGFIKIDTEGAEYSVLSGALETIQRFKPIILSELSDILLSSHGENSEKVLSLLTFNGYRIMNAYQPDLPIKSPFEGEIMAIPLE